MAMDRISRARCLAAFASAPLFAAQRSGARPPAAVRIGATPSDSYSEPLFLQGAGAPAHFGLSAEVTVFSSVGAIVQALLGGAIDVGLADMLQVAGMRIRGLPYAFFAGGGLYTSATPTTALVVARESPVRKAADLEGQSIAVVSLGSLSEVVTKNWLVENGGDIGKMRFIELPVSATIPAILRGTVAAGFVGEPFLTQGKDRIRWLGRAMDTIAPRFLISSWCASSEWLGAHSRTARELALAFYATARWANAHHDESARILADVSKLDLQEVRTMNRVTWATSLEPRLMQPVIDAAVKFHAIERPVAARDLIAEVP
jgi:NitT/TauT family transport system substrate-binding protein